MFYNSAMEEEAIIQPTRKLVPLPPMMTNELEEVRDAKLEEVVFQCESQIKGEEPPDVLFDIAKNILNSIIDPNNTLALKYAFFLKDEGKLILKDSDIENMGEIMGTSSGLLREAGEYEEEDFRGIIFVPDMSKNDFYLGTAKEVLDIEKEDVEEEYSFYLGSWDQPPSSFPFLKLGVNSLLVVPLAVGDEAVGGMIIYGKKGFIEPFIDYPAIHNLANFISNF
jgi:hypothetical protein